MPRGSRLAHPVIVFGAVWTTTFALYGLHLSYQLIYGAGQFLYVYCEIIGSFLAGYLYITALLFGLARGDRPASGTSSFELHTLTPQAADLVWRRTKMLLAVWALMTCVEVAVSGGLPIVWLLTGNTKTYQDFGIKSVHGFLLSMLLACAMVSFYLYLETQKKRYLNVPLLSLLWFIISITRGFFVALVLQMIFLYLCVHRLRAKQIVKLTAAIVALVILFGLVGDVRSGGDALIRAVAEPTQRFPTWLPSGFLWVYIYVATPLNNLFNTIQMSPSVSGFSIAATTSHLFPSFIRKVFFSATTLSNGDLVNSSLNVSTGFVSPYLDMGLIGVGLFGVIFGSFAGLFWTRRRYRYYLLGYAFLAQTLVLSIFYDFFLDLAFLFQLFWFSYLLRSTGVWSTDVTPAERLPEVTA